MRRSVVTGYARGEETRKRILDAALQLFGHKGFDSVSTREIALAAAVPPASLRYYYTDKQGLYFACLDLIRTSIVAHISPALEEAETILQTAAPDVPRLIHSFCSLQAALIDAMVGGDDNGAAGMLLVRHDLPSEGLTGMQQGDDSVIMRVMGCFTELVVKISGARLDSERALRLAGLINGQLMNIYVRRRRLLEGGWDINAERFQWLKDSVRMNTTAILRAYLPADKNSG